MTDLTQITDSPLDQKHYTPEEIAEKLGLSRDSIIKLFRNEEGVLKLSRPGCRYKRTYTTLRIPESVARRVYARLSGRTVA